MSCRSARLIGVSAKHQSSLCVHAPSRTAAACSAGCRTSSSISDVACCATESVPYVGTFVTTIPRAVATSTSTML